MSQIASALIVGPLWQKFMIEILKDIPEEDFKPSAYASSDKSDLKPVLRGVWQNEDGPHTILTYVDKDNPRGDEPRNPANDSQYNLWETGVRGWALASGLIASSTEEVPDEEETESERERRERREAREAERNSDN